MRVDNAEPWAAERGEESIETGDYLVDDRRVPVIRGIGASAIYFVGNSEPDRYEKLGLKKLG